MDEDLAARHVQDERDNDVGSPMRKEISGKHMENQSNFFGCHVNITQWNRVFTIKKKRKPGKIILF